MGCNFDSMVDEHVKMALEACQADDGIGPEIVQQTIADTWVGTFIHQFFIEDAHLRQSVIDFVCKHRPGSNPRLGDPYRYGSHNFNIEIIFDDGITLFRFPIPGVVVYPDDKVKAEVATIRYVAEYTAIPVPHIHHWGTAAENPTGLHVPFIIMDHIPHVTTIGQALEDPDFEIPSIPESEKREYLYQQMAEISLQLHSLTSDRIGSLDVLGNSEYAVTSAPLSQNLVHQVVNCSVPAAVLPPRDKTYSSSNDYFTDTTNMELAGLLFMNEKFVGSDTECRDKFVARYLMRDLVRQRQNSTGGYVQPSYNAEAHADQTHETFRLWGDDLRPENVLLDGDGVVVGVVDWEYTYFAPETFSVNPPWWLLLEVMDNYIDEDAESDTSDHEELADDAGTDTSDQEELPDDDEPGTADQEEVPDDDVPSTADQEELPDGDEPDAADQEELPDDDENAEEEQGDRDFQEQWDELVRTYLRALEKAEQKLQNCQQLGPLGNHLCSSPRKGKAADAQQLPLSQLMRQRWDEDRKEFALTTSLSQDYLLDKFFWDYIDESYWGENAVGGHEGRLDLLNPPSRMLMDWLVHCRAEAKQKGDPKVLLDQVLGQMDGKDSALIV